MYWTVLIEILQANWSIVQRYPYNTSVIKGKPGEGMHMNGDRAPKVRNWAFGILIVILCLVGIALRLQAVCLYPVWMDEAFTGLVSIGSNFWQALITDPNPPLYYVLQYVILQILDNADWSLRLISLLAGCAIVVVAPFIVPNAGKWQRLALAAFFSLSPPLIYYAAEARQYSLSLLLSTLAIMVVLRIAEHRRGVHYALLTSLSVLICMTHLLGILTLLGLSLLVWFQQRRLQLKTMLAVWSGVLPLLVWMIIAQSQVAIAATGWLPVSGIGDWHALKVLFSIAGFFVGPDSETSGMFYKIVAYFSSDDMALLMAIGVIGALLLLFIVQRKFLRSYSLGIHAVVAVPGILALLAVLSTQYPLFVVGRYDVFVLPFMLVFVSTAFHDFSIQRRQFVAVLIGIVLLIIQLSALFRVPVPELEKAKQRVEFVQSKVQEFDAIVILGVGNLPFLHYWGLSDGAMWQEGNCFLRNITIKCRIIPLDAVHTAMDVDSFSQFHEGEIFSEDITVITHERIRRIWLVSSPNYSDIAIQKRAAVQRAISELGFVGEDVLTDSQIQLFKRRY